MKIKGSRDPNHKERRENVDIQISIVFKGNPMKPSKMLNNQKVISVSLH